MAIGLHSRHLRNNLKDFYIYAFLLVPVCTLEYFKFITFGEQYQTTKQDTIW